MSGLYQRFKEYWNIGLGLSIAMSFFLLSRDRLEAQLLRGSVQAALGICTLTVSILWMLLFIRATLDEPEMLRDQKIFEKVDAKKLSGMVEGQAFAVMVILSLGFGGLIATVTYPITYCIIAVAIQITDCLGLAAVQRTIFRVYQGAADLNPTLYEYYLYKPHFVHRVAKLVGFMSALALAVAARFSGAAKFSIVSSILIITTILVGEFVLFVWRRWLKSRLSGAN
jgi:hypothetical protein